MTISATTQGLRMGVATSSSRPTVPFDGQVISETDTDSLKVYNGSAWVGTGGLVLVTPTSITSTGGTVTQTGGKVNIAGASSVSLNGVFTSTYQNYLVLFDSVKISAGNISIFARLRVGGTDTTSGTYYAGQVYGTYTGTGGAGGVNGGTSWSMFGAGTTEQQMASLQIFAPQATQKTTYVSLGVAEDALSHWAGYQSGATSFDGFTFFSASGNYSGNITVYGYQKS